MSELIKVLVENLYNTVHHGECFYNEQMLLEFIGETENLLKILREYEIKKI